MRRIFLSCALAACIASTSAGPAGYTLLRASDPTTTLQLTFAVKYEEPERILSVLERVSDPRQPTYGQHISKAEADNILKPSTESVSAVLDWMHSHNIHETHISDNQGYITAYATVAQAEELLGTKYYTYTHEKLGITINRCEIYTVPAHIKAHLDFVSPTTRFPSANTLFVHEDYTVDGVTPDAIRSAYGINNDVGKVAANKQQAAGFLQQYASLTDLNTFFTSLYPPAVGQVLNIVGPNNQSNPGLEASLDVQYIMAIGGNINTTYWYTDGSRPYDNEPFLVWLTNLAALSDSDVPKAISVSYGDDEDTVDINYAVRVTQELQAFGARGISIMFSSGDGGVAGSQPGDCPNGFIPTFPAANPYVTAVGATDALGKEVAARFSGGGFSNYWARPTYQDNYVAAYFKAAKILPASNLYNHTGAGFPDVAAIGTHFNIVCDAFPMQVAGTSASSPTFTGMIALLNDHRMAAGKSTLGWLNPLLYQHPEIFVPITSGSNPGCNTTGFFAASNWSPVTGLGVLNYTAALQLVMSLP